MISCPICHKAVFFVVFTAGWTYFMHLTERNPNERAFTEFDRHPRDMSGVVFCGGNVRYRTLKANMSDG